jgi:hypothetical protein
MRLRWDWFRSVAPVPYVPTLGVVHPLALTAQLLQDVLDVSGTGRFLPHDKDQRWATSKDEMVLVEDITHTPHRTIIPTLARRSWGLVKIHCYGTAVPGLPHLAKTAGQLRAEHGAAAARVIWFHPPGDPPTTAGAGGIRVLLKTFGAAERPVPGVTDLRETPAAVQATFPGFAQALVGDGFAFLHQQMQAGNVDGPVLVAVEDDRVVGAIGPMQTMPDPAWSLPAAAPVLRGPARRPRSRPRAGAVARRDAVGGGQRRGLPALADRDRRCLRTALPRRRTRHPRIRPLPARNVAHEPHPPVRCGR